MTISRRALCSSLATLTAAKAVTPARSDAASLVGTGTSPAPTGASPARTGATPSSASHHANITLPDKANFPLDHIYLNAAYTHPFGRFAFEAGETFLRARMKDPDRPWPDDNARDAAVAAFARLINAAPEDIAVVPSTMEGENLIVQALDLNKTTGVTTDAYHYSLPLYGELEKRGVPVAIAAPRDNRIELDDLDRLVTTSTRLVAVSAVSSDTGFAHDLKSLCDLAHGKGALVYADIIQAAGAVPLDVKATGVDFCCAGAYKWLMADFGIAFLYVRPDRLKELQRVQVGWRQYEDYTSHIYPFDPPGSTGVDYTLGTTTAARFEVSTPSWEALAVAEQSLAYLDKIGVDTIARHRAPMLEHLQSSLPAMGLKALTPSVSQTPMAVFSFEGAAKRLGPALAAAKIKVQLYRNRIRISPSVYNDMSDIEHLLRAIASVA
jgi:selenocysteine lyase/cysteine desulfurase